VNVYKIAKALTAIYLATALGLSFSHIAHLFGLMGSGWEMWIAPVMIDMVAIIGKISMGPQFTAKTRRAGKRALVLAGGVSFLANVTVGYVEQHYGSAVLGAIVVAGALWAEGHLHNLRPVTKRAPRPAAAPAKPATKAPRAPRTRRPATPAPKATVPAQRTAPLADDTRAYL
jgi:hypothetical protein